MFNCLFVVSYSFSTKWRSGQTWQDFPESSLTKSTNWREILQCLQWSLRNLNQYFQMFFSTLWIVIKTNKIETKNKGKFFKNCSFQLLHHRSSHLFHPLWLLLSRFYKSSLTEYFFSLVKLMSRYNVEYCNTDSSQHFWSFHGFHVILYMYSTIFDDWWIFKMLFVCLFLEECHVHQMKYLIFVGPCSFKLKVRWFETEL